jgi:hypothetical protein
VRGRDPLRWSAASALLVLLVLSGVTAGLLARDLLEVRGSLREARTSLSGVGGALGDIDVDAARASLAAAEEDLSAARERTGSRRWSVAAIAPVVRHPIALTRDVVETASAAVDLADVALTEGGELLDGGFRIEVTDGQLDLEPLLAAQDILERLPLDRLVAARDRVAEPRSGWIPGELRDAQTEILSLADGAVTTVGRARATAAALPPFLGSDQPRRYFVGMQTPAELRGTGGLIGYWVVLSVDEGRFVVGDSEVHEGVDDTVLATVPDIARIGSLRGDLSEGVDADPAFLERYARFAAHSHFSNVNLDPDLPTTARVALDLFELRTGVPLDGLVLLDPIGLQRMLEATGSTMPLSRELATLLEVEEDLAIDRFASLVSRDIYDVLGADRSAERQDALRELGDTAIRRILDGGWDGIEMARALVDARTGRHLQVFSEDPDEQEAFAQIDVTGALEPPDGADLLAVTANNAVGGKQDVHLGHEIDVSIRLGPVARAGDGALTVGRGATIAVTVDNPLPSEGMDLYVIGSCIRPDGTIRCFEGPPGSNRTWFSLWAPVGSRVVDARADAEPSLASVGTYRGLMVVDRLHETGPGQRATFEVDIDGRVAVELTPDAVVYELHWWRQAKAVPDLLTVEVHPPEGWTIADLEVVGGGDGRGFGVHGDGRRLTAEVADGVARLEGTITADAQVRVHLTGDRS